MSKNGMLRTVMWTELREALVKDFPDVAFPHNATPAIGEFVRNNADYIAELSDHSNAAIEKAVKAEREACAEEAIARGERNKYCPPGCRCADPWHIADYIRSRGDND